MENPLEFLVTEGDFSRFNGVVVNATKGNGLEKEFYTIGCSIKRLEKEIIPINGQNAHVL